MPSVADAIISDLRKVQAQREIADAMSLLPKVRALQDWQCKRLLCTHQTFVNQPRFEKAMRFFVDELYGPKDFSERDADLVRVIPKLASMLPQKAIGALHDAVSVNALSFDLDLALVNHLDGELNEQSYAMAYRDMGRLDDRIQQIDTIYALGEQLADVVQIRGVTMLIKIARKPAQMAGLLSLHEFLERGFNAFRKMGNVHEFIDPVVEKEREIMYYLHSDSFDIKYNPISMGS